MNSEMENKIGNDTETGKVSRRRFITGAAVAAVAAAIPLEPVMGGKESAPEASVVPYGSGDRATASFNYRTSTAAAEQINAGVLPDNGDSTAFLDFSGNYSKALLHDALGVPNANSWLSLKNAFTTGKFSDFENIIVGTPGGGPNSRENGPQGGLAFDLEGLDSHATVIPPAPRVTSAQTAAEAVEHYWGALLRTSHSPRTQRNALAAQAVNDMNNLSFLQSSQNNQFPYPVAPQNLFRGKFVAGDGNVQGRTSRSLWSSRRCSECSTSANNIRPFFPPAGEEAIT